MVEDNVLSTNDTEIISDDDNTIVSRTECAADEPLITLVEALTILEPERIINTSQATTPYKYHCLVNNHSEILKNFWKFLKSDWRKWIVLQVKNAMLTGKTNIFISNLDNRMWKKGRTILNCCKRMPDKDLRFYNKKHNILITEQSIRNIIEYLGDIGLKWFVVPEWTNSMVSNQYYSIYASWVDIGV